MQMKTKYTRKQPQRGGQYTHMKTKNINQIYTHEN